MSLPEELLLEVFSKLEDRELLLCERACSYWNALISQHSSFLYARRIQAKLSSKAISELQLDKTSYKCYYSFTSSIESLLTNPPINGVISRFPENYIARKNYITAIPINSRVTCRIDEDDMLWTLRYDGSMSLVDLEVFLEENFITPPQETPEQWIESQAQRYPDNEMKKDVIVQSGENAGNRAKSSYTQWKQVSRIMPGDHIHQGTVYKSLFLASYAWYIEASNSGCLRLFDLESDQTLLWDIQVNGRILYSTISDKYVAIYMVIQDDNNNVDNKLELRLTSTGELVGEMFSADMDDVSTGGLMQIAFISNLFMLIQISGDILLVVDLIKLSTETIQVCSLEIVNRICLENSRNISPFELITLAGRPLLVFAEERGLTVYDLERRERVEYQASGSKRNGRWLLYEEIGYETLGVDFLA